MIFNPYSTNNFVKLYCYCFCNEVLSECRKFIKSRIIKSKLDTNITYNI